MKTSSHFKSEKDLQAFLKDKHTKIATASTATGGEQSCIVESKKGNANKFGARKCVEDNITFDSEKERDRYRELKLLLHAGEIKDLSVHHQFRFVHNEVRIADYFADFVYRMTCNNALVIEDVKGYKKGAAYQNFRIKKSLMLAFWGFEVKEL
jgi:hypothetical protein